MEKNTLVTDAETGMDLMDLVLNKRTNYVSARLRNIEEQANRLYGA